jgi:hypothetical protein
MITVLRTTEIKARNPLSFDDCMNQSKYVIAYTPECLLKSVTIQVFFENLAMNDKESRFVSRYVCKAR